MLPPGHVAGAYLAGKLATQFVPQLDRPEFLIWCAFFGFFPDLDTFVSFFKLKKFISREDINHRKYATHAPLLYLLVFFIAYFLFPQYHYISWAFLIGTWSHFFLDSFGAAESGVQWLYPFKNKLYSFNLDSKIVVEKQDFLGHWIQFVKNYTQLFSFKLEVVLIIIALIVLSM